MLKINIKLLIFVFLSLALISSSLSLAKAKQNIIVINKILYNPLGNDTGKEWIELYNRGNQDIDLTNYDLDPSSAPYYTFPHFVLKSKAKVIIHINTEGTNSATDLYTGPSKNMSNTKGVIALFNSTTHSTENLVDYIEYGAGGQTNESKAIQDNIWTAGDFIPNAQEGYCLALKQEGQDNNSSQDWQTVDCRQESPNPEKKTENVSEKKQSQEKISFKNLGGKPPQAEAGPNKSGVINQTIIFDGSKSFDPDDVDLIYFWNFGDGSTNTEKISEHIYKFPGKYIASLYVSDGYHSDLDTLIVTIYPKPIIISEFMPEANKNSQNGWIEIYNPNEIIMDISGWQINDSSSSQNFFVFPDNSFIDAKKFLVLLNSITHLYFDIKGGCLQLLYPNKQLASKILYPEIPPHQSIVYGTKQNYFLTSSPTPGLTNILNSKSNKELPDIKNFSIKPAETNTKKFSEENFIEKNLPEEYSPIEMAKDYNEKLEKNVQNFPKYQMTNVKLQVASNLAKKEKGSFNEKFIKKNFRAKLILAFSLIISSILFSISLTHLLKKRSLKFF